MPSVPVHLGCGVKAQACATLHSSCSWVEYNVLQCILQLYSCSVQHSRAAPPALVCRRWRIDPGWMPGLPVGSYFRFSNVTVSCTGNLTHPLPPGACLLPEALAVDCYVVLGP